MAVRRFYCPHLMAAPGVQAEGARCCANFPALVGTSVTLDPTESHHASKVVRIEPGALVQAFDGRGSVAEATVTGATRDEVQLRLTQVQRHDPPVPRVDVAAAIPKGPRVAAMVQGLSQAGADCFIPLRAERGVVAADRVNRERLERVAIESAKQCGRSHLLSIAAAATLRQVVAAAYDVCLIGTALADAGPLSPQIPREARCVLLLIGPEGGWTTEEMQVARAEGAVPWQFGPHVMRIETACCAATAIVRYLSR